jgi:Glucodextranase, domain B/PASTA domain
VPSTLASLRPSPAWFSQQVSYPSGVRLAVLACLLAPLALVGCGGGSAPKRPPVRLTLAAPGDGSRLTQDAVNVSGTVSPATATVTVEGKRVSVSGGSFETQVPLDPGQNVVDVIAGAEDSAAAMTAVRVFREIMVEVPDLVGQKPSDASDALTAKGLKPKVENSDGGFDFLLPGSRSVCATDPDAGAKLAPGSTVTVITGKTC